MSTKMSNDLNLTRPSSRVSRPPGGATTISFGDSNPLPPAPPKAAAAKPAEPVAAVKAPPAPPAVVKAPAVVPKGKVGIAVAGEIEPDTLVAAISKALTKAGIKGTVVTKAKEIALLPYSAKALTKSCDVVIATTFITSDPTASVSASLNSSLMQIGLTGDVPIIPAIVNQDSLLEAKAVLPALTEDWVKSIISALTMKGGEAVIVEAPVPEIKPTPVYKPELNSADELLDVLRESLKAHGARGIVGLGRKFRIMDDDNSKSIDLAEFTKAIGEHALEWTPVQIKAVFDKFDQDKSGSIDFDEFIQGVRGALNPRRKQLVLMAFEILDADKSGVVELNDISKKYDASKHPDIISGKRTTDEVLREFLDTFDSAEKDGKVTPEEFCNYYSNVSASIDEDDYFELMIRNAWHISGGEGWCANTSCRRVLVTHADGHQSVEEIKNDIGISDTDKEAILAKLVEQGVSDIKEVEMSSGVKFTPDSVTAEKAKEKAEKEAYKPRVKGDENEEALRRAPKASVNNPRRQPGGASTFTFG